MFLCVKTKFTKRVSLGEEEIEKNRVKTPNFMKLNTVRNSIFLALLLQNAFGLRACCCVIGYKALTLLLRSVSWTHLAKIVLNNNKSDE